ncbi:MAG: TIM barrel protein [Ignavibacteria bacterium]|nr:TIM barrel protein [Ignavibacteria bacterium]
MLFRSRREFIKRAAVVAAAGSLPLARTFADQGDGRVSSGSIPFDLGMASYSFRAFTLDQALDMTKRLGLRKITLKDMHLPMNITAQEMAVVHKKMDEAGIELSSCGVVYMKTAEEIHKAFVYAKLAGTKMMVGVPEQSLLGLAEEKVKETDIALAIHNHGPTDQRFPSPESAYSLIKNMDKRMGLCIDVGHTQRLGLDPASEVERFFDRLLDVHIKDVSSADAKGSTVEIGRGVIDIPKLLRTLARLKYTGTLHFEHEKDQKDSLPGVAESVGYVRGVLATL